MSSLYSIIPGLVPSQQEIIEAELLVKQILEAKFPDLDLREGTGLRDLVLRPTAYAFALLSKANDYYFTQNTIKGVDNNTPQEVLDDILSNWFLTRNQGTYAVISARMYFARQKNITITTDIAFSPDNTLQYFPVEGKVYSAEALQYDAYSNEWYLDIDLIAEATGAGYNLSEGSLLYFTNFDPYFLRAEINYLVSESTEAETNSEFISRAASSISTRNLINIPSVDSRIRAVFNYIDRVVTVGMGDPDMVRDMVKVVFGDDKPVTPVSGGVEDEELVLFMPGHRFVVGQILALSGAVPDVYNGTRQVVSATQDAIRVAVPNTPGYISVLPTVGLGSDPVYIHNGGMTDVYCGDRISTGILQLTTDSSGKATLSGPIFAFERSQASGGAAEDTIPFRNEVVTDTYSVLYDLKKIEVAYTDHNFMDQGTVKVSGLTQQVPITSISCVGLTVTVQASGLQADVGSKITISGVSPSGYNGTYTVIAASPGLVQYSVPASIQNSGTGLSMRVSNASINVDAEAAVSDVNNFSISLPGLWYGTPQAPVTGTLSVSTDVPYTVSNPYDRKEAECTFSAVDGIVTGSLRNHGYTTGRYVSFTDATIPELEGSHRITDTPTGDTFVLEVPGMAGVANASGSAKVRYIVPWYDYGFSTRQELEVDFGVQYANKTASFMTKRFRDLDSLQDYLESPENRVLCGDYLARGFNLHLLDVSVVAYNGPAYSTSVLQSTIDEYLDSMQPGSILVLSDLVAALSNAGITNIQTPVGVKYTHYNRDLTPARTGMVVDYLDPRDKTNVYLLNSITSTSEAV